MTTSSHFLAVISAAFSYDHLTGTVTLTEMPETMFQTKAAWKTWNKLHAGRQISRVNGKGYVIAKVLGRIYTMHRVAWAVTHGEWPEGDIDHINGDKTDNRISNLRAVSRVENSRNMPIRADNKSGVVGVSWVPSRGLWVAFIKRNGKSTTLKSSKIFEVAVAARKMAEADLGFHENHGRKG